MYSSVNKRLSKIINAGFSSDLHDHRIGLEKESLRVTPDGHISQTPHPRALGSALTHSSITTDYSEALLEFVTPPFANARETLRCLNDVQHFVYQNIGDELLWATSMPCAINGDASIPIAEYGQSNLGKMKNIYRRGLGHRYGRPMQVIAGVHFNYSYSDNFWKNYQLLLSNGDSLSNFKNTHYFALTRNLLRYSWLIPYLFGASPAVCKSFFGDTEVNLQQFDQHTYFQPWATSLRVADIGYQNNLEKSAGLHVDYSNVETYVKSLQKGISTPYSLYQKIGTKVNNEWRQLNDNILQIENEYYSAVRPKPLLQGNEKPSSALLRGGTQYIELRLLDVNAYEPLGINEAQLYFLEAFLLFCLLRESPAISKDERRAIQYNQNLVAHQGRQPKLMLQKDGRELELKRWALEICNNLKEICALLDSNYEDKPYTYALDIQREAILDPDRTPSARILAEMKKNGENFFNFALRTSKEYKQYFKNNYQPADQFNALVAETELSIKKQYTLEESDNINFDQFLRNYFNQP